METAKNIKERLCAEYKYRLELHAHTSPASPCSEILPEELVKTYHELGYDAVVITNHFLKWVFREQTKEEALDAYLKDFQDARAAAEKFGLNVYLGAEMRFEDYINDYLVYGVDRTILSDCYDYFDKGVEAYRRDIKLDKSVFIQAHPFRNDMTLVSPEILDGIEVFNMHPGHNSRIGLAAKYAKEKGFEIITAGSDYHHKDRGHEGVSALRVKSLPRDGFELAKLLKNGDYLFEIGGEQIILP